MATYQISAAGGPHDRRQTPVSTVVPYEGPLQGLTLVQEDGTAVSAQWQPAAGGIEVTWIIEQLPAGSHLSDVLTVDGSANPQAVEAEQVLLSTAGGSLAIHVGGNLFSRYTFQGAGGQELARPFFYPLHDGAGRPVTRGFPMEEGLADERTDHPHHRSLYVAHGDVNGVDCWSEGDGHGYIRHRDFGALVSGPVWGGFVEELVWTGAGGDALMAERRAATVFNVGEGLRLFDLTSVYEAAYGSVTFGDTKEGGLISVRVAGTMKGRAGGRIENAYGAIGEGETWGRRAPWCDYSGPVVVDGEEAVVGITLFDHPENLRHPTYWHVRDYGLMTANPFGISHFKGLSRDGERAGDRGLAAGEVLVQRYRVLLHPGQAKDARVADHYHGFAHPPQVTVQPA